MVLACHVILQDHVIKGSCDFMVSSHQGELPSKFGGHRHSDSKDIMNLVCHVILEDHVIKGSFDFMGGNHSR